MTTSGSEFYKDELEPEQIETLLKHGSITANEVVEGLWHGQVLVRTNAARGARYVDVLPDPGEAMLRIASKDTDVAVRSAIVTAVSYGLGSHAVALPLLFDAVLDGGEGIRDTALSGLERRLLQGKAEVMPWFVSALADVRSGVAAAASQLMVKAGGEAAIPALIPLLGSDDPRPRRAAYDILDQLKRAAVSLLIDALRDPKARELAARLLGGVGETESSNRLKLEGLAALAEASGDAKLFAVATKVLGEMGRPREVTRVAPADVSIRRFFDRALSDDEIVGDAAVDEVLHALRDGRGFVRQNAARWLGKSDAVTGQSGVGDKVVNKLGPIMRDPDAAVRGVVARSLGLIGGDEAIRTLVLGLADPDGAVRESAVSALHGLGPEALGVALEAVHSADPPVIVRTFEGLRQVVTRFGASSTQSLADALRGDRDLTPLAREVACLALGDIGPGAEDAVPALLVLLKDRNEDVRAAAATALGFIGVDDDIVLGDLGRMLADSVPNVRRQAALAAARITGRPLDDRSPSEARTTPIAGFEDEVLSRDALRAGATKAGLESLVASLRDGRELVRQNAARAIGVLADEGVSCAAAAQPLGMLLRDGDVEVRKAAVGALADLGKDAVGAAWALTGALVDPDDDVREAVIAALVALHPECEPFLVEALRSDTASAKKGVFVVWYRLAGAGVPALATALFDPSGLIRLNAARALELLAKQGAANAIGDLEARLADPVGQVRAAAQSAIDAIQGGKPKPVVVLEPDPIDIAGFYDRFVEDDVLANTAAVATPERVMRQLSDGRVYVRANAANWLGLSEVVHGDSGLRDAVVAQLVPLLRDPDANARTVVAQALGRLGGDDAVRALAQGLADPINPVSDAVATALFGLGPDALGIVLEGLKAGDPAVAQRTTDAFRKVVVRFGAAATHTLADALGGNRELSSLAREVACLALGDIGPAAKDAVPTLVASLKDADEGVRAAAATALSTIVVDDALVLSALDRLLADTVPTVRRQAALAAARISGKPIDERGPSDAKAFPIEGFERTPLTREVLHAGASEAGLELLLSALRDGRPVVRQNAARAIGGLVGTTDVTKAAGPLAMSLRDSEVDVRKAAIESISDLGKDAAKASLFLTAGLTDGNDDVREAVIATLVSLYPEAEAALIEALRVDTEVANKGIFAVWFRLGGAGIDGLKTALRSSSGLIRLNAAYALELLAKHGASTAMAELEDRLGDPIKQVRIAAQAAMDAIQGGRPRPPVFLEPDPIEVPGFTERLVEDEVLAAHADAATPARLVRSLRDGRAAVRANAALLLANYPASDELSLVLPGLAVLARDEATEVRVRSLTTLGRLIADERAPIDIYGEVLVVGLGDRTPNVRKAASAALEALGERAFPALAMGLGDSDERALGELTKLFVKLGEPALNALPDALSPLTPELHFGALTVLLAFERDALTSIRPLVEPLAGTSESPEVRAAAGALLDKIDGKDLIPVALDPSPLPLPQFADVLMSRDSLAAAASELRFDLLAHAMTDGRDLVRANATTGIEVIGSAHELAWPYLVRALKDPSNDVRVRAAEALAALPPRRDVAFDLVRRLDDSSPRVIKAAEAALKAYGEFAIDAFMYALDDRPELVGRNILPMLAGLGERAVDKLVLAQRYDSPLVRLNALIGIRLLDKELGKRTRLAVAQARKDDEREVRLEALRTLEWIDGVEHIFVREPRTLPTEDFALGPVDDDRLTTAARGYDAAVLAELLVDGRRAVRENAATAHGLLDRYHPWLGILLKDSVGAVQVAAAMSLAQLGEKSLPSARALIGALIEDEPDVRRYAKEALLTLGTAALPTLIEGLWVPGDIARKTVVPFIEVLGADATPAIIEALDHPSQLVVLNALQVLGRLYTRDPKGAVVGMPKVIALIKNPLPAIIGAAQKCLFRLEGRTPAEFQKEPVPMPILGFDKGPLSVDTLRAEAPALDIAWMISAFSDGRPIVRENAARAAGFMPNSLKDLLIPLTIALKDGIPEVQVAAADAFATLQAEAPTAVPALTFALRNATERVKRACMVALDAYGPERVAAELVKHLVGREEWMLQTIGKVTARMSEVLVPALASFAKRSDESLIARENAVRVLADLGQKARAAEPILLTLLPEMEGMLAFKAAFALGCVARPSKELIEAMQARLNVDPRPSLHLEIRSAVKIIKRRMPVGAA